MNISSLTNQEIIQRLHDKDPEVTGYIYENLKMKIKGFLRSQQVFNDYETDDLASEVIAAIFRKETIPEINQKPMAYLMGIARNMWYKQKYQNKEDPTTERNLERFMPIDNVFYYTCEDEGLILINNLINNISKKCRELLELARKCEDAEQICMELGFSSLNYYYKKKHNCKARLRDMAEQDEECCIFFNLRMKETK